jgi:hypothetical protein
MKKTRLIVWLAALTWLGAGNVQGDETRISGYIRNDTAVLMNDDNRFVMIQDTLDLRFEHSRGKVSFMANPYLYRYPDRDGEIDLRQAYMEVFFDAMDIRIGKQQIIWGKADGVFITDVVSPKDMRNFLLPEFEEIRLGVDALKIDLYLADNTLEFVWIPVFTPSRPPESGSIWYQPPDFPVTPTWDTSRSQVDNRLADGEVFLKFSLLSSAIDFELMAGSMWDDDPTWHRVVTVSPSTGQISALTIQPEHHRLQMSGGAFSTTVGGIVLRGEAAYYQGKYFYSENMARSEGVLKKDYTHSLLGTDFSLLDLKLGLQLIQKTILDYEDGLIEDENDTTVTALARMDLLRETLSLELFAYYGVNHQDSMIRPKIAYALADGFDIQLGANVFNGTTGTFGRYDANDTFFTRIKYSF